ncbi:hypothetical protein PMAYCL1PPCAC_09271, partial [Pristionchus mayeri]
MTTPVKVYIVLNIAGAGFVTDFDGITTEFDLKPAGKQVVTVLSSSTTGVTYSDYKGTAAPKIYSAGFDAVGKCEPLYKALSADNAAKSKIGIVSALTTVDFGSTDASNQYHVGKYVNYLNSASIGQSFVAMSPG